MTSFNLPGGGELRVGHVLDVLKSLEDKSVQTCITSPPYWNGDRDTYGIEKTWWPVTGLPLCTHRGEEHDMGKGSECTKCFAWYGELGIEDDYYFYIGHLEQVFYEVYRILKDDGTLWIVIGDKHAPNDQDGKLKEGDLMGVPFALAKELRDSWWYWRRLIAWERPNHPRYPHEHVLMFSKSEDYYYDNSSPGGHSSATFGEYGGFLQQSIWKVNAYPHPESHFETFPEELVKPMIRAGAPEGGTVLDPFAGSGTTGKVAIDLGRVPILIELNPKDAEIVYKRLRDGG